MLTESFMRECDSQISVVTSIPTWDNKLNNIFISSLNNLAESLHIYFMEIDKATERTCRLMISDQCRPQHHRNYSCVAFRC